MNDTRRVIIRIYYICTLLISVHLSHIIGSIKKISKLLYLNINAYIRGYLYPYIDKLLVGSRTLSDGVQRLCYLKPSYCLKSTDYHKNPNIQLTIYKQTNATSSYGFTLVELIVTVSIMAIIVVLAAPNIFTQLAKMEAERIRYRITNTLAIAKAESLIRRQDLLVCLSDANGRCNKASNNTLLLFADNNDNQHFDLGIDLLIDKQQLKPKYATLHLHAGGRNYIKFYGNSGKPTGHFGHIKYCPNSIYNKSKYQISFNQGAIIRYKPNSNHPTECSA